jgi:hypothetical protein
MTWGATPEEWAGWQALGLTTELLPVVADPGAKRSVTSSIKEPGKLPSLFNRAGEMVGMLKWPQHLASDAEVARWSRDSRLGICLQARRVKAFDIDIPDPAAAQAVADVLELTLGALPVRGRSNSGKRLMAFALDAEFGKRIIKTPHGAIELLSTGNQFLVAGTHPSGVRYEWVGGVPTELPTLSMAEVDDAWAMLADAFGGGESTDASRVGQAPSVARAAADAADPMVGWLDEHGWTTGAARDGRVDIRCPWAAGHSTDTGASSTSYFPAGVGGFAQGHFRCLHASCAARTDGDFLAVMGVVAESFDVVVPTAQEAALELPNFQRDKAGHILAVLNNVLQAVRRPDVCELRIGHDLFKDGLMYGTPDGLWAPFMDHIFVDLRSTLERKGFQPIKHEMIKHAVLKVSMENQFDSAQQWIRTLRWDGVPRAAGFFARYFCADDTPYTRAVGAYTWSALAGRCFTSPVKADMVPVFIGLQGAGKTSAVSVFSPTKDAFVEISLDRKDEDIARSLRGKLVGEIAELKGLASRESESIKAWVSRETEEWVGKYREFTTRFDRRLLCFGTGNKNEFLDDDTGERRWLPMIVNGVDVKGIQAVRDQLWAEGLAMFQANGGEVLWRDALELARAEHHKFKVVDPWMDPILDWLAREDMDGPRDRNLVRMHDVLTSALGLTTAKIGGKEAARVGKVLTLLGYERVVRTLDGRQAKVWVLAKNSALSDFA